MKIVQQAIEFHEYYWYLLVLFVVQYVYRTIMKSSFLMMRGIPAIVITKKTITLSELGYAIEWNDIEDIQLNDTSGESPSYILIITVKEPWKYISQIKNPVMRYYRWYMLEYQNPFIISLSGVEGDTYEVYNTIESCFYNYRGRKWPD